MKDRRQQDSSPTPQPSTSPGTPDPLQSELRRAERVNCLRTLADTGWSNGSDTWAVTGTTREALESALETGRLPGSSFFHGKVPPGHIYFNLTKTEALEHVLCEWRKSVQFAIEDYTSTIPRQIDDAAGYAEDRAPQHYLLQTFGLEFTSENRIAMLGLQRTLEDPEEWGGIERIQAKLFNDSYYGDSLTPRVLRELQRPAEDIIQAGLKAVTCRGALVGLRKDTFLAYAAAAGDTDITTLKEANSSHADFRINVGDGLPIEFFSELKILGPEVHTLLA